MKDPLLPPQIPKNGIWGRKSPVLSPFSLFENGGDTEGVKTSLKMISAKKKRIRSINEGNA
ncbi:hypothetical protein JW964_14565, partial [candidate division KSB1 bacterium]|nr:hypothetical protein [candidate division KSB1 bacterium]